MSCRIPNAFNLSDPVDKAAFADRRVGTPPPSAHKMIIKVVDNSFEVSYIEIVEIINSVSSYRSGQRRRLIAFNNTFPFTFEDRLQLPARILSKLADRRERRWLTNALR